MNVLIVGNSNAGSWQMRGVQLGAAIGARATLAPTSEDWTWADVVVLVKRAILAFERPARLSRKPIVWDALDFWSQPAQNGLDEASALMVAREHMARVQPSLVIGATSAMAADLGGVYLPHHSWAGLVPTPPRAHVRTVAYQGSPNYLGRWHGWLEQECARRGWSFVVNPASLSDADILVSFRDAQWDGWICRRWKSGVKLVNAIAAGRPIITQPSAATDELDAGYVITHHAELSVAFDWYADYDSRAQVAARSCALTVQAVADRYRQILASVTEQVAA